MRIAYFANYSPVSLSNIVFRTLKALGHDVRFFSPNIEPGHHEIRYCEPLVNVPEHLSAAGFDPELVLFVESSVHPLLFPLNLDKVKVPTCWWGIDNHMNYRWHKDYVQLFDHTFFAMSKFIAHAENYSNRKIHWLPLACDPAVHKDYGLERDLDCTFVGNLNPRRKRYFDSLTGRSVLKVYSGLNQEEMARMYTRSKTGFNLAIREDLNMRVFEVMASGAALITQDIGCGLKDLFIPGEHLITHKVEDASTMIGTLLNEPELAAEIGRKGCEEVHARHTYAHRLQNILDVAMSGGKNESSQFQRDFAHSKVLGYRHYKQKDLARTHQQKALTISTFRFFLQSFRSAFENSWFKFDLSKVRKL